MSPIPQFFRQTPPQYHGQQLAGLGARANAGIGQAAAQLGSRVAGWAESRLAEGDRDAVSRTWRQFEDSLYERMRAWGGRREELSASTIDPVTGDNVAGYDLEIDAFGDAMKGKFEELSNGLSKNARREFERRYNEALPRLADHVAGTMIGMRRESVVAESRGLVHSGRASDALDLIDAHRDLLGPELHQKLVVEHRIGGALNELQGIAEIKDWATAAKAVQDPEWQHDHGLDIPEAAQVREELTGFVGVERARAEHELEVQREKTRDVLADKLALGQLDYESIDASGLDESEQQQYVGWMRQDAERRLSGQKVVTDEAVRHELKAAALDIPRGRADYRTVVNAATEAKAASKLDDDGYRDVLAAARSELSSVHAETLRSASQSAQRQLVTVSESALERYATLMASGRPGAKETLALAENQRQTEYRLLDLHDSELRAYLQAHPETAADDLYRQSRRILLGLRRASAAERARLLDQFDVSTRETPAPRPNPGVEVYDQTTRQRITDGRPSGPPSGMEGVWDSLSVEEQTAVLQLLRRGFTTEDLIRHYQQQPAIQ